MKLSVIIVSYNVKYLLEQCLRSVLRACDGLESEVWVVDNASSDGSYEYLHERFQQVHFVQNEENVGFSRANNLAIRKSSGQYVLL
ncbi:MAG: glycosyltransferase, partial [Bacteroidaceae bacterium]|nr:glycosyltransferase [Bacteroidaceae bacterium]